MSHQSTAICDVQSSADTRNLTVHHVGVKELLYPITFLDGVHENPQHTIATCSMSVCLPASQRGAHMSRFIEILQQFSFPLSWSNFPNLLTATMHHLGASTSQISIAFPFFLAKAAPISHTTSLMDYRVTLHGVSMRDQTQIDLSISVPVTMVCPCSKAISQYGAHNQRSRVDVTVRLNVHVSAIEIIQLIEMESSCPLFGLLKRMDEKFVTEYGYDHPKFVEDLVRDIATQLKKDPRIVHYRVESENFESIHNHSVYACIDSTYPMGTFMP